MSGPAMQRALAGWGEPLPDWIRVLAQECDESTQAAVASRLGYSAGVVSSVLRGRTGYGGDLDRVEDKVRGALMGAALDCPEMGRMPLHTCRDWRARARKFSGANGLTVRMYRACRRCPINGGTEE